MSTTTTNLGLVKPQLTDAADITAMNPNWDILDAKTEHYLGRITDTNVVDNPNYTGAPYEGVIAATMAVSIGLPDAMWHIKYFRHADGNGHGAQIAIPLNIDDYTVMWRTSDSTTWDSWRTLIDSNGGTINANVLGLDTGRTLVGGDINSSYIRAKANANDSTNYRALIITNTNLDSDIKDSARVREVVDGVVTDYKLYHEGNKPNPADIGAAATSHASSATTYGVGNASNYGHLKLSDVTNGTSGVGGGVAATPAAVKAAYDLANSKAPMYTYGTTDLTAGSSALETGKLYFCYE